MENNEIVLEKEVNAAEPSVSVVEQKKETENCLGIASMAFGILGLIAHFVSIFPLSAYFPFIGLFLALGDKLKNKNMTVNAKIGLILSIITYTLSVLSTLIALLIVVLFYILYLSIYILAFLVAVL